MDFISNRPEVALFVAIALGHLIGWLRVGPVQLGGICGTLIVALVLGQSGVVLSPDLRAVAFALFIFALGFTAGPQFFTNLRNGWRYGILSFVEVVTVVTLIAIAVVVLKLDPGTAAGLLAGSATESAVIGTAAEALGRLALPAEAVKALESNIATAYSITYLFGLIAIVVFTSQIAPLLLRINLRKEAAALAHALGAEDGDGDDGGTALPSIVGRAFRAGPVMGQTVDAFEREYKQLLTIQRVRRGGEVLEATPDLVIRDNDILLLFGRRKAVIAAQERLGGEVPVPPEINLPIVSRDVVLDRREAIGQKIGALRQLAGGDIHRGVFIARLRRLQNDVPPLPGTVLQRADVLTLYGTEPAVDRALAELGHPMPATDKTDLVYLGLGVVVGMLIGSLSLKIGTLDLTLGTGGGALVSGLVFGWLRTRHPKLGTLPAPAAEVLKDLGLATFIAAVGLSAGPDAIRLIREYGLVLPVIGVLVSAVPAAVSLLIGHRLLKIEAPILLGAIAGQHCSTPTISALVSIAGNSTPVIGYTVTYAISNVLLPLLGPIVVWMAFALG
ncbi:aspartate-alanine antiporter [Vineibacter terrae]|uniref:Aspartate-alanine antiporter n=1 Tax=Vineibacter terrae TaxID=2586908 RepID=A0A5C8PP08_9HYPH|nr:aspartate-alanine antiporter [Vineibacter terrae]TXL75933.1 aspartate-alanine antiporter [Vineibacter terrae]